MSNIQQLTSMISALNEKFNQIEQNSKRIFELPENESLDGSLKFAISRPLDLGEKTEHTTLNAILEWCIEEMQNIENATRVVQMLPPELLSEPRRIKIPVVDEDDNDVPIVWRILGVDYVKETEVIINIPDASEGNYRKDLILGTKTGDVIRFAGTESTEGVIEPIQPENTVLLTTIVVFGDSVYQEPTEPVIGNNYITKLSERLNKINVIDDYIISIEEDRRTFYINNSDEDSSILGCERASGYNASLWSGSDIWIWNNSENDVILKNNSENPNVEFKFIFSETGEDFVLKPNSKAHFKYNGFNDTFEFFGSSLGGATELEVAVFSDVDTGAIEAGETIAEGTTFTEFVQKLLSKTFYPTFTAYSISGSAGSAVEVGTGTKTVTVNFTRGNIVGNIDAGVWNLTLVQGQRLGTASKYWVNGIDNGTSNSASVSEVTTLGTNSVLIAVDYNAGAQPKDSKGNNYLTPQPAGTLNGTATWQGFYYRTAIAGNSAPTASDIRTGYTARRSNAGVINMPTGTTNVRFDVFVPQGSSLTSAIDEGNLNLNITAEFILQGSNFSGLDANGDEVLYKHYVRIVDNPYPASSNIAITVT